ncbi:MAG: nucleoside-diphosphate kinase [Bacteroidales bacterium]|nr:nucleoside-diphosphate kinase [Bacteroidales bacterium]
MAGTITLTMIKPLAVSKGHTGAIITRIEEAGFRIVAMKYTRMSEEQAGRFYAVHRERPFYGSLVAFMSSGPIVAAILQKDNAVDEYRRLIGATDPAKAEPGTIRALYGTDLEKNAVHGSDSDENARVEASFFFSEMERF